MAAVLKFVDDFHDMMDRSADPRTNSWLLISSPFPTAAICIAYVYIVKVLGPRIMENRKPFELKNILILYNLFQVILSAWLFHEILVCGWLNGYSFWCQPVDYSHDPLAVRMAHAAWWYYFSKFTEFFDTFFFVLRKKNSHISTLHVFHHGIMPFNVWFVVKFAPGGHASFCAVLNTFVHIVMYSYYLLAAMGPQYKKYLWWKKYLTGLQLMQFVVVIFHEFQLFFINCNYPKSMMWLIGSYAIVFYLMFSDFYKKTYTKKLEREDKVPSKVKTEQLPLRASNGYFVSNGYHKIQSPDYCVTASTDLHLRTTSKM